MADLVILFSGQGDNFPTAAQGQMALQANTGQLWGYLNNSWTSITGGSPFNVEVPMSVFINGYNRDCSIKNGSLKIQNKITSKVDTCTFVLTDNGDLTIKPEVGNQIDVFDYNSTSKIYSGEISTITQSEEQAEGLYRFQYQISSVDYTKRLEKRLVTKDYTNEKAGDIIKDIIDTYYNEFSYINVEDGPIIDYVSFSYIAGNNAIKKIAKLSGYDWYVDHIKDIHFFLPSTNYASYQITENCEKYIITNNNKYIDFKVGAFGGGTTYAAIVATGEYTRGDTDADSGSLCEAIKNALVAQIAIAWS
ncbi:MAG: hypothetical protein OQK32_06185, partial [Gammaproteobacteria bacterium]|nr:hypothetical protein [Gammaproteobacteria bacterium]